jgi:hypothetical protein
MHFYPQSLQCGGLYKEIDQYDFVGSMGSELYRDLERFIDRYPTLEKPVEKTYGLKRRNRAHTTNVNGTETMAASRVLEFYTPYTLKRVLSYYAIDYMLLPLDIPQWAEQMLRNDGSSYGNIR